MDQFDSTLTPEWRIRVLIWIASPKLLLNTLANSKDDSRLLLAVCGQTGRYQDFIKEIERMLYASNVKGEERILQKIQAISSRFIYGRHVRVDDAE